MAWDQFLIAPLQGGLQTDVSPFLIPDDAFAQLNNAYVYRGRVRKRFGSQLLQATTPVEGYEQLQSRLRINIGVTGAGPLPLPTALAIGQMFSIGNRIFTVNVLGAPVVILSTDIAVTATIDTTGPTVDFAGIAGGLTVYFYPALPVMGLKVFENAAINSETVVAFDTQFAYQYTVAGFERLAVGAALWAGSDSQFFWTTNYRGANQYDNILYATNFNENELMRYFDGTTWFNFNPQINGTDFLNSARILVAFKNRLLAFNTWEGAALPGNHFPQRVRYSQVGSPLAANAWREDTPGLGNAIDAATSEAIVTVEFIKDRLVVYFERSTWELVYLGNQANPFTWQKINTELGAESTFSVVPFDKVALGVGNVGIHACNGSNVDRIDEKIPDAVFEIHNDNNGVERVYGIRDYFVEMVYWSFPDPTRTSTSPFNNKVLVFNYTNGTWAFNDDSITCFGYFQQQDSGAAVLWSQLTMTWEQNQNTWSGARLQGKFRNVIAGNQEGYVFLINADQERNAPVLQITQAVDTPPVTLTVINHNLSVGDFVLIENMQGSTNLNGTIQEIDVITTNTIQFGPAITLVGTYTGGGTLTRVSQVDILTKQYNFYLKEGDAAYIPKVEWLVDRTPDGGFTVDWFISSSNLSMLNEATVSGTLLGTSTVSTAPYTTLEASQSRVWHDTFMPAEGECVQFRIYFSDTQMVNALLALSSWTLHAMNIHAQRSYEI
jgi:Ubiquitin-activating enzyme E1 FCCH domain